MAITGLAGSTAASINIKLTDDNYNQPSVVINKPVNNTYSLGTAAGQVDLIYSAELTLAPSATTSLDLDGGTLADVFGNLLTFVNVKSIRVHHAIDSAASSINLQGDFMTTNFGASFSIAYVPNGYFDTSEATAGYAVVATTGDAIDIVNNDGSNSAMVSVEIMGTSV